MPAPNGEDGNTICVYYSSRRQSDKAAADIKAEGTMRSMSFAQKTDPYVGIFGKFMSVFTKRPEFSNIGVTVGVNIPSIPTLNSTTTTGHRPSNILLGTDASVMCTLDPPDLTSNPSPSLRNPPSIPPLPAPSAVPMASPTP